MRQSYYSTLMNYLGYSVLVHFLWYWCFYYLFPSVFDSPFDLQHKNKTFVDVVYKEQPIEKSEQQIVRQASIPEDLKTEESDDPLAFLSQETQRVKKQVQAYRTGLTKNRELSEALKNHPKKSLQEKTSNDLSPDDLNQQRFNDLLVRENRVSQEAVSAETAPSEKDNEVHFFDVGVSTIGESLSDKIPVGNITVLNTNHFQFYSFYSRIEELIRYNWESAILSTSEKLPPSLFEYKARPWVTELEVWLMPNGEFHSTHLMKGSGIKEYDIAASRSFALVQVFPNPPKKLIGPEGLIKLQYNFQVTYRPPEQPIRIR